MFPAALHAPQATKSIPLQDSAWYSLVLYLIVILALAPAQLSVRVATQVTV